MEGRDINNDMAEIKRMLQKLDVSIALKLNDEVVRVLTGRETLPHIINVLIALKLSTKMVMVLTGRYALAHFIVVFRCACSRYLICIMPESSNPKVSRSSLETDDLGRVAVQEHDINNGKNI
ncbi:hypothetical protein ACLB2K_005660 [Fragaria x ananassa]